MIIMLKPAKNLPIGYKSKISIEEPHEIYSYEGELLIKCDGTNYYEFTLIDNKSTTGNWHIGYILFYNCKFLENK